MLEGHSLQRYGLVLRLLIELLYLSFVFKLSGQAVSVATFSYEGYADIHYIYWI
jgi:hypothetical protein